MLSLRGGGTTTKQSLRILLNQKEERKKGKVQKNTDLAYALPRSFSSGLTKIAVNEKLEEALSATSSHVTPLLAMTVYAVIAVSSCCHCEAEVRQGSNLIANSKTKKIEEE